MKVKRVKSEHLPLDVQLLAGAGRKEGSMDDLATPAVASLQVGWESGMDSYR